MSFRFLIISLLFFTAGSAQDIGLSAFGNLKARSIGPAGMSGRVTSIDVVNNQPEIIYIGTASGGLWKSESGGIDWEPIFDGQSLQSIGAVAVQQSNPDVIWAGTGEGNPRNSHTSGGGIYKSIDGGKSWKLMGLEKTITIHRIVIHRDDPDIIWVAALGSAWGESEERGVYKTTDGGKSWNKKLYVNKRTGCADLVVDPKNPNKLMAAMWEYHRDPYFFTSGGRGSGLYVSFDGGESWKKRNEKNGLPKDTLGRIGLAIAPSNPKVVYALVETKNTLGLYQSQDGGFQWHLQSDKNVGNRPFYYADIYVDPKNENRIYNLWSYVSLSIDGGKSFKTILDYGKGVHPDHHAFWIHPNDPSYVIDGNDGGLNISHDRGKNWRFVENLPIGQFYHVRVEDGGAASNDAFYLLGGMQDNGSWRGPAYVYRRGGIRNHDFQELYFGDGFDVLAIPGSSEGYAMSQGGNLTRYNLKNGSTKRIKPVHQDGKPLRFNWNAALAPNPFKSEGLYFGSQYLHYSPNKGQSWEILSPDLTTNDPEKQKQAQSGGLTIDATQAENYTTITCIAPSPSNANRIWVGTDDGRLQYTTDGGKNWNDLYKKLKGAPENGWIHQIFTGENEDEAFVALNNYRQGDWGTYLYHTDNNGKSFSRIADGSQVKGYALSILQSQEAPNLLFFGTENGLWISLDKGKNWERFKNNYPAVSTMDLDIHRDDHSLAIGTFGRSLYVIDNIYPLIDVTKKGGNILEQDFYLFPRERTDRLAKFRSVEGTRFAADAHFIGENRPYGAPIDFWIKNPVKDEKAHFYILSEGGVDTLRYFQSAVDTGFNRKYWSFNRDGVRYPSHTIEKDEKQKPGIFHVAPGKYQLILKYNNEESSQILNVGRDLRTTSDEVDAFYNKRWSMLQEHFSTITKAKKLFDRLKKAQSVIREVEENIKKQDQDSLTTIIEKEHKVLNDSIKAMKALFLTPEDFVGYDHVTVRLNNHLQRATAYIIQSEGEISQMAILSTKLAELKTETIAKRIDAFFKSSFTDYQKKVEPLLASPFENMSEK